MRDEAAFLGKLRDIKEDELELMLSWRNAPPVRKNMYTRHEINLTEHLTWWEKIKNSNDQIYFMYELQGKAFGIVAFTGVDQKNRNSSWAFYAATDAPKGIGSKMEYLALEKAFNEIGLHKLCCEVLSFNHTVINLHQKFGFKVEGILRDQHLVNGEFVDIFKLGIISSEWSLKRNDMFIKLSKFQKL